MKKIFLTILSISIMILFFTCSDNPGPDSLIKIGNEYIGLTEFFKDVNKEKFLNSPDKRKKNAIKRYLNDQLFLEEAKKKIKNNTAVKIAVFNKKIDYLLKDYINKMIFDSIFTQPGARLEKAYKKLNRDKSFSKLDSRDKVLKMVRIRLLKMNGRKAQQQYRKIIKRFEEEVDLEINTKFLNQVSTNYNNYLNTAKNPNFTKFIKKIDFEKNILAETKNKTYDLNWLENMIKYNPDFKNEAIGKTGKLEKLVERYIFQKYMLDRIEGTDWVKQEEYKRKIREAKNNVIINKYFNKYVKNKINIQEEDLQEYYNQNKSKYNNPLEEIRSSVKSNLRRDKIEEKRQEILNKLKKKYDVKIYWATANLN